MAKKKAQYWTEAMVFDRLQYVFPDGPHVRIPQVRNKVGFQGSKERYADGIVLSVYPSRGLWMAGIEIKVSRSDWKKELMSPDKSAPIQAYCDYWYIAAPKGLIDPTELPETWGLIEVSSKSAEFTVKLDKRQETKPLDRSFAFSLFRKGLDGMIHQSTVRERVEEQTEKFREELHELRAKASSSGMLARDRRYERLKKELDDFEEASGIKITQYSGAHLGKQFKFVTMAHLDGVANSVIGCADTLKRLMGSEGAKE